MKKVHSISSFAGWFLIALFFASACKKTSQVVPGQNDATDNAVNGIAAKNSKPLKNFMQVNLIANNNEYPPARVDANFVNAWGIAFAPNGTAWVNAEGTGL